MDNLSIIIPLDFSRRPVDLLKRAIYLIKHFKPFKVELVFSISNRGGLIEKKLCQKLLSHPNTVLVYDDIIEKTLPPLARLRNIGAAKATRSFLLFLDVDVLVDPNILIKTFEKINKEKFPYIAIPVIYLSRKGSKCATTATSKALSWYLSFDKKMVDGIAINSSLIMISRDYFHELNGFHDTYTGHGYEDFDFLLRALNISTTENLVSENFFIDRTSSSPAQAWGFRSFLAKYSLPIFLDNIFAVHLHHDRCRGDGYYEHRLHNFEHFKNRLVSYFQIPKSIDDDTTIFTPLWTYHFFSQTLNQYQKNVHDYRALFEWQGVTSTPRIYRVKRYIFYYLGLYTHKLNLYIGHRLIN